MRIISNDQNVRSNTLQDLKEFNSESLATQAKKGEQLVSMMPAFKKAVDIMGDDIVELSTENDALKNKIGSYDEKWLFESKAKLLKQIDDDKRANSLMSRMQKQVKKTVNKWLIFLMINCKSEFDNIVSKRDKLQHTNIIQLNFDVHDSYMKDEKLTTNFEAVNDEDIINKGYLEENLFKINGHLSLLEKDYNGFKLQ